ncbi:hypothetical protein [Methanogenium organophilum]|uniref:Uncharacterized protein n=1 Tax=Methanogenium organophilum TaxID=2199 RepID=A0A9X9S6K1_METOG|nr:hypothetical protein [Methanogenium organophilum]WAI01820.1 hypothetical protein OU421_02800 [Methanogenium organophilum]
MTSQFELPKDVMLDTNAMVYLYLYVDTCDEIGIDLDQNSFVDFTNILDERLKKPANQKVLQIRMLKKGYNVYKSLNKLKNSDSTFYFSKLAKLELNHVCLENKYHQELSECNIPYRIRQKDPFKYDIPPAYLTEIYTTGVINHVKRMEELLSDKGVEFNLVDEDPTVMGQTIDIITTIFNQYIHLQSNDLYIYCLAVQTMSTYFLLFDGELKNVAEKLRTDDYYREYREKIIDDLCRCRRLDKFNFDEEGKHNVIFPEAVNTI